MDNVKSYNKGRDFDNFFAIIAHDKVPDKLRDNKSHIKKRLKNVCAFKCCQLFELVEQEAAEKHLLKASSKKRCQNVNGDAEKRGQVALRLNIAEARR